MNIRDTRRVQDGFNQRGRYKARVVPFAVIANAEIQHVDIFIAVAWVDIEKKKPFSRINNTTSSQTEPESVSTATSPPWWQKSNVHTDKQPRMFTDKTDTKAGFVVAFSRVFRDSIVSVSRRCISVIVCLRGICNFPGNTLF